MRNILKYFSFSVLLMALPFISSSQEKRVVGPRIGFDIGNLVRRYFEPGIEAYSFSLDYEVDLKYYPVLEGGLIDIHKDQEKLSYFSDGFYGKLGLDYNFMDVKGPWDHDMVFGGLRIGAAYYRHEARDVVITDDYWGNYSLDELPSQSLQAYWMEAVFGLQVEVLDNVFIGWSLRGKLMLFKSQDAQMSPYIIPGYGKVNGSMAVGIRYFVSWRIPIKKVNFSRF